MNPELFGISDWSKISRLDGGLFSAALRLGDLILLFCFLWVVLFIYFVHPPSHPTATHVHTRTYNRDTNNTILKEKSKKSYQSARLLLTGASSWGITFDVSYKLCSDFLTKESDISSI
eukprot:CFRG8676